MNSSPTFEASLRTIVGGSAHDLRDTEVHYSDHNASTESIPRKYTSATSVSPCALRKFQRFSRERLRSASPNSGLQINEQDKTVRSRSQSLESLPLAPLHETTTGDSGTGDSITQSPADKSSTQAVDYDTAPVYGLDRLVIMPNRYAFDPAKIIAYRNRNRKHVILPEKSSVKSQTSGKQVNSRQNSRDSKKSTSIFARLLNTLVRPSPSESTPFQPAIRHHPSHTSTEENQ